MNHMKNWQETAQVFAEMKSLLGAGRCCALATLIRREGSSYRQVGAKLLLRDDGSMAGNVSGGCLEADLIQRAGAVRAAGNPVTLHYDTGSDESVLWGLGLGCNGKIDIFLQPCPPGGGSAFVDAMLGRLDGDRPFAVRVELEGPGAGRWHMADEAPAPASGVQAGAAGREFFEAFVPPPDLLVVGAGDDAMPVVSLAHMAGLRVTVVDHRPAYLTKDRFPGARRQVTRRPEAGLAALPCHARTYAVIMNHNLRLDQEWAALLSSTIVPYIGLLGPQARRDRILEAIPAEAQARFYGPIGLDIGAEGPEQIALSIVAEVLAVAGGCPGASLRTS